MARSGMKCFAWPSIDERKNASSLSYPQPCRATALSLPDTVLGEGTMVSKPKGNCDLNLGNVGHKKHARPTGLYKLYFIVLQPLYKCV
jgi:hypothetical protein